MLYDHIDLRVRNLELARAFYGAWLPLLGLDLQEESADFTVFFNADESLPFFAIAADDVHRPGLTRIAFRLVSRAEVDRVAAAAKAAGARAMEDPALCPRVRAELLRRVLRGHRRQSPRTLLSQGTVAFHRANGSSEQS